MSEDIKKVFAEALKQVEADSRSPVKQAIRELIQLQRQHYYSSSGSMHRLKASQKILTEYEEKWDGPSE